MTLCNLKIEEDVRVAFYVSNKATRLRRAIEVLIDKYGYLLKMVCFVFIDNVQNEDLKNKCNLANIEFIEVDIYSISKVNRGAHVSDILLDLLTVRQVSYLICFGDKILKGEILSKYRNRIINFHPSLLPAFKGLHAIDKALEERSFLLGNSAHIVDEGVDAGPVIMQSLLHNSEFGTYDDVLDLQIAMLIQLMIWLKNRRLHLDNNMPYIKDASYSIARFIPNLEIDVNF